MASKVSGVIEKINVSGTERAIASTAYGYCETAAGTAAKVVDMTDFKLYEGVTIHVKFKEKNSAANPTLNVQGTGAKPIVIYGTTAAPSNDDTNSWYAGAVLSLTYDGTSWVKSQAVNTNTWRGIVDNLTSSTATTTSLSGKQGYLLANGDARDNTKLPLSGGQMTGPLTWKDGTALPETTSGQYFLVIDAFASGGTTKWISKANALTSLGAASSSHNHNSDYVNVTGDTMTGDLVLSNTGNGDSPALRFARNSTNTDWRIKVSSGQLQFASATNDSSYTTRAYFKDQSGDLVLSSIQFGNNTSNYINDAFYTGKSRFSYHASAAHASINTNGSGWLKVKIKKKASWMLTFTIRLYTSYAYYDYAISGYNYGSNHWYSPTAVLLGSNNTNNRTVKFGYDDDAENNYCTLWVAVQAGNYYGIDIFNVTNGHSQYISDIENMFEIIHEDELTGTQQGNDQTIYGPWRRNETVTNATTAGNISGTLALANLTKGDANTALMGKGSSTAPAYVSVSPSISITAGTADNAPKVNLTVLGVSGTTAQELTKATTGVYGATKLYNGVDSTSTTLAATANAVKIAYDKANNITASSLGLSNALHFIGITSTELTNGSTTSTLVAKTTGSLSKTTGFVDGDVVMDGDQLREYVWSGSAWRLLGITTSTAYSQTATGNSWIASITQGTDGKITATTGSLVTTGEWNGNAGTATILKTARTIWGQSFDGSANVTGNLIDVGNQIKLLSGNSELQFLTSSGGAANGKFGKLGLNTTYANVDFTNYILDVNGKARIGALDGGQHVINGNVQLNAQSGSYNEGLRINRSTTGYANIYLGGTRSSASGNQTGGWWIGTLSTPTDATSNGDAITNTVFTISNNNTSDTLSIKGTRGATIGTNSGWAIRPRLAVGTTYQTGYTFYVNGTSFGNDSITLQKAGEVGIEVKNTQSTNPNQVAFIVGSSGNGGIYSRKHSKWIVYADASGNVTLNGNANTATSAGKWTTARNISISDSDGTNTGTAVSIDGSAAATLKLPATIKASLTGNADTATSLTNFVVSTYTIPASKGVRIKYPAYAPVLISCQRSTGGSRLILIGGGYGEEGTVRNDFTEVVSPSETHFTWSMPQTTGYACTIEIMHHDTSGTATVWVESTAACTFTEITALTSTKTNRTLLHSANTYAGANATANMTWGGTYTLARINGTNIKVTMPGNPNTNTTYTFAEGSTNGAFSVTPSGGSAQTVSIHGLGTAAYKAVGDFAPATHSHDYLANTDKGAADRPIYITGNAATATTYRMAGTNTTATTGITYSGDLDTGIWYVNNITGTDKTTLYNQSDGVIIANKYSTSWISEIYQDYRTGQLAVRGKNNGTWTVWRNILDSTNYTNYTVTKTGTGASGSWGISITGSSASCTGNAETATLATSANYVNLYEARGTTTTLNKTANYVGAGKMFHLVASSSTATTDNGKPPLGDANVLQMNWDNSGGYDAQLAISTQGNRMEFRDRVSTKNAWREVVTITPGTAVGNTNTPVYVNATGVMQALGFTIATSVPANAVFTDTNNAATHTVKTTTKYYVTGTETATTSTGGDTFDTGIYATTEAGQLNATSYKVNENVTLQYNTTDSALEFIFA